MPFSDDYRDSILNYVFSQTAFSPSVPATIYVALSVADPTGDGSGLDEPTDGDYARVAVTNNSTNFPAASGAEKTNGTAIVFPTATEEWTYGPVTHVVFMDAATSGNMIGYAELDTPIDVDSGETVAFLPGVLTMSIVDYPV